MAVKIDQTRTVYSIAFLLSVDMGAQVSLLRCWFGQKPPKPKQLMEEAVAWVNRWIERYDTPPGVYRINCEVVHSNVDDSVKIWSHTLWHVEVHEHASSAPLKRINQ